MEKLEVISVPAINSKDFVRVVFSLYESRQLFMIDKFQISENDDLPFNTIKKEYIKNDSGWLSLEYKVVQGDQPAQIVFTSGTESKPKAIVLSYKNLADVVSRLNNVMGVDSTIREYIGVPVTYSFGLGRCRAIAAVGGAMYIPPNGFDPMEILEMLKNKDINAISAVPSLWRIILSAEDLFKEHGHLIRWIEIGSQYMAADEKLRLRRLFPQARIVQHYGLTEASRSTFLDISKTEERLLESVGAATGNIKIKLTENNKICIKGDNVALGKIDDKGALVSITDNKGWLTTNDVGVINEEHLWYSGRADDQINVGGIKISPDLLEGQLVKQFDIGGKFSIFGLPDKLSGMKVALAYLSEIDEIIDQVKSGLTVLLEQQGVKGNKKIVSLSLNSFPLTETGKIRRKDLTALVSEQIDQNNESAHEKLSDDEAFIAKLWKSVVGELEISSQDRFVDVGGDSLSTLQIVVKMERAGCSKAAIQSMVQGATLAEIACANLSTVPENINQPSAIAQSVPSSHAFSWALNATRGLMVCFVVLAHWGPGLWNRLFGQSSEIVNFWLNPIYRMGTPGFALIFGVGVGYFFIQNKRSKKNSIAKRIRFLLGVIISSWIFLSSVYLIKSLVCEVPLSGLLVARSFYNVLCYYFLGILSIPAWKILMERLPGERHYIALWLAVVCWVLNWMLGKLVPDEVINGIIELPRLMIVAKYGYFRMGTAVFLGCSIGSWLSNAGKLETMSAFFRYGLLLAVVVMLITLQYRTVEQVVKVGVVPFDILLIYLGLIMVLLSFFYSHFLTVRPQILLNFPLNCLIVLGVMALPVFALHEAVIPIKEILLKLGLHGKISLLIPLAISLSSVLLMGRYLYQIYFSTNQKQQM